MDRSGKGENQKNVFHALYFVTRHPVISCQTILLYLWLQLSELANFFTILINLYCVYNSLGFYSSTKGFKARMFWKLGAHPSSEYRWEDKTLFYWTPWYNSSEPQSETLWFKNTQTMDKVQMNSYTQYVTLPSETFELHHICINIPVLTQLFPLYVNISLLYSIVKIRA